MCSINRDNYGADCQMTKQKSENLHEASTGAFVFLFARISFHCLFLAGTRRYSSFNFEVMFFIIITSADMIIVIEHKVWRQLQKSGQAGLIVCKTIN